MTPTTNEKLNAIRTGFHSIFQKGLQNGKPAYQEISTIVPSSYRSETYGWLGQMPELAEWSGSRTVSAISESGYQITNKKWQSAIAISRDDIEDDNLGVYAPLFEEMGLAASRLPDKLVFELLKSGKTTKCYDAKNFFAADHPVIIEGSSPTDISNLDAKNSGIAWYLLDCSRAIKPIIYQQRQAPAFERLEDTNSDKVFMENKYHYGVQLRSNVGFGFWQLAYCSEQTLDAAKFWSAADAMEAFKGTGGVKLGISPTHLVVPPSLRKAAEGLIKSQFSNNMQSNLLYNRVQLVVSPHLA